MASQQDHFRRTQALEAQLGRLSSQVGGIKGHVKGLGGGLTLNQIPAWSVVRMDNGGALSGDDWDSQFDNLGADSRIEHSLKTASGEVPHINSDHSATRLKIRFTGQGDGPLTMKLGMVGDGKVQVKINGTAETYTDGAFISIDTLASPLTNELVVMADGHGGAFQFSLDGMLFDGVNRKWVNY